MSVPQVFDRLQVRRQRDRAAPELDSHAFLLREVGRRLSDRLCDIRRNFSDVLDLGCHDGGMAAQLRGRSGIERIVQCDLSPAMARLAAGNGHPSLAADEENLPFAPGSFDLVLSNLSLHWVNDLPGALLQVRQALKADGLFIATMAGGGTLEELRGTLIEAELAGEGGAGPRVSPFADVREAGHLLMRAGFALPVVDADTILVSYDDPLRLLRDLRGMGETNASTGRRKTFTRSSTLAHALALLKETATGEEGRFNVTFRILTLTAWCPHPDQPRPLPPGSGRIPLGAALGNEGENP